MKAKESKIQPQLAIYSDFDGTITVKDIGDEIFKEFGEFEPWNTMLRNDEIEIKNYWHKLCSSLRSGLKKSEIEAWAKNAEIDAFFAEFAGFCKARNYRLTVISDGFDAYIKPIFAENGFKAIEFSCNKLIFRDNQPPEPVFPGATEGCNCKVASCKRNAILKTASEGEIIVYIGDGYSDCCGVKYSDIVFAKKELAAFCNKEKIPHYPWKSFFDVRITLENILKKGKIKPRTEAKKLRNEAFKNE
ncbi:MAG: phosphoserine phosphatase [Ignavibacteria bacterium]|nr:phosphoserine phosphatase [Ignavibacteria bacterium]